MDHREWRTSSSHDEDRQYRHDLLESAESPCTARIPQTGAEQIYQAGTSFSKINSTERVQLESGGSRDAARWANVDAYISVHRH